MRSALLKYFVLPVADKVMHTHTSYYLKSISELNKLSAAQIRAWQDEQLQRLILHAYDSTKYYRSLMDRLRLRPSDITCIDDLSLLPELTKEDIRSNFNDLQSAKLSMLHYRQASTGGSTGNPLKYLRDNRSWSFSNANNILNWEQYGYKYGDKYIALGSTSLFVNKSSSWKHKLYYLLKSKIGLNGINMSDQVCHSYVQLIKEQGVRFVYGYASSIYLLAKYCLKKGIALPITACFPTSEVLTDEYRTVIKKAFNCGILNCYGAHDGGVTAYDHDRGYFEVGYNCLVRTSDEHVESPSSFARPALLTDVFNYSMPLINYRLGDDFVNVGTRADYNGQTIEKIGGRASDILKLENGHVLTGPGFTILFKDLPVNHYCIQKTGVNQVKCYIFQDAGFTNEHEALILGTLQHQLGHDVDIDIEYTLEIKRTPSGKVAYFLT
jgi:phenylacetate-CoA ligase